MAGLSTPESIRPDKIKAQIDQIDQFLIDKPAVGADMLSTLGWNLILQGSPAVAMDVLDKAMAMSNRAFGPGDPKTEDLLRLQGWAAHAAGDDHAAETYYRRYLQFLAGSEGTDSVPYAHWAPHLALTLLDQEQPGEAERVSRPAFDTLLAKHGSDKDWTMLAAYALGRSLLDQGRPADAEPLLQKAADAYEKLYGHTVPIAIYCRYYLGLAMIAQGKKENGLPLVQRSLVEAAEDSGNKLMGNPMREAIAVRTAAVKR